MNVKQLQSRWSYLSNLELPPVDSKDVTILLGNNVLPVHDIFDSRRPKIRGEAPEANLTPFGWVMVGPTGPSVQGEIKKCFAISVPVSKQDEVLRAQVERFWNTEAFGVKADVKVPVSEEEKQALDLLESTINHVGDRYEVGLMWRRSPSILPNNRQVALRLFYA